MGKTPAHLAPLDPQVSLVPMESLELMARKASLANPETPHQWPLALMEVAESAPTAPRDPPAPLDLLAHLDPPVAPDPLANLVPPANLAQPDLLDLQAPLDPTANPAPRDPPVPPVLVAAKDSPDPKVPPARTAHPAPLEAPAPKAPMANPVLRDPLDPQDPPALLDPLAKMVLLDPRDLPAQMPSTALAPNELVALSLPRSKRPTPLCAIPTAHNRETPTVLNPSQQPHPATVFLLGYFLSLSCSQSRQDHILL